MRKRTEGSLAAKWQWKDLVRKKCTGISSEALAKTTSAYLRPLGVQATISNAMIAHFRSIPH
ncbi:MAG TPA: hypothetical protein VEA69_25495, partial [Tepidisphaeraceae bacterium]|nr:hypothetical protein [Tepidisphaeraceae bacterium]